MAEAEVAEIHTLFMSGLPVDVKEREVYNLFRLQFPGYQGCRLQMAPPKPPAAFVTLDSKQACLAAIEALNGSRFDPDAPLTLRMDLAKANSKPKRMRPDGEGGFSDREPKHFRSDRPPDVGAYGGFNQAVQPQYAALMAAQPQYGAYLDPMWNNPASMMPAPAAPYNPYAYPPAAAPSPYGGGGMSAPQYGGGGGGMRGGGGSRNGPCSTVFVANLSPACTEDELKELFMPMPGFSKMRFSPAKGGGCPVAWVDFSDVNLSTQALNSLNGHVLASGPGQDRSGVGMRIEFAKSKMGERPGGRQ